MSSIRKSIMDHWLFPAACCWCGRPVSYQQALCPDCIAKIRSEFAIQLHQRIRASAGVTETGKCGICGAALLGETDTCISCRERIGTGLEQDISMGAYAGCLRRALLLWKHSGVKMMTEPLAHICCDMIPSNLWGYTVTSVPCHPRNRRRRGWDPARELAKMVAASIGSPYRQCFIRLSSSRTQKSLDVHRRQTNAARMLKRVGTDSFPKTILLFDDVRTTGASVRAAGNLLYRGGCRKVYAFTLAQD